MPNVTLPWYMYTAPGISITGLGLKTFNLRNISAPPLNYRFRFPYIPTSAHTQQLPILKEMICIKVRNLK